MSISLNGYSVMSDQNLLHVYSKETGLTFTLIPRNKMIVLDQNDHPVHDWPGLPLTISSHVKGWKLEALWRTFHLDYKCFTQQDSKCEPLSQTCFIVLKSALSSSKNAEIKNDSNWQSRRNTPV